MHQPKNASTVNGLFVLFSIAGFVLIFAGETMEPPVAYFAPTAVVMLYALVVNSTVGKWEDRSLAEHHLDTIYFMGFLFTLFSLITLFYRLQYDGSGGGFGAGGGFGSGGGFGIGSSDFGGADTSIDGIAGGFGNGSVGIGGADISIGGVADGFGGAGDGTDGDVGVSTLAPALMYIGISVGTSIAGVLFRSIARGSYLARHPERSVDTIEAFLAERAETTQALQEKEEQYLTALQRYIDATERFSVGLEDSRELLLPRVEAVSRVVADQTRHLQEMNNLSKRFGDTLTEVDRRAAAAPWETVTEDLERFHRGVSELNQVLDSLFTVLEHKVERIR